ncbi:hypothetical protein V8Q34_14775 [Blautia sp. JLR.GB0024]|uniref:hypothetical protein n=1 Tax=Blautia sp. JLR.GB0024 TaxID=3123295 RepID=UPI0030046C94
MNKLMGFFELQTMSLPSIPWKEYTGREYLQDELLWTVRSAVFHGNDLNLPRLVGVNSKEAKEFANQLLEKLAGEGIVIFYPYFIANKSGTLEVKQDKVIIEAVKADLWNMVTLSDRDVTIQYDDDNEIINGDGLFLSGDEKKCLLNNVKEIKKTFRDDLLEGKSILLEWSFAQNCDENKEPVGDEYLVFYEARTV